MSLVNRYRNGLMNISLGFGRFMLIGQSRNFSVNFALEDFPAFFLLADDEFFCRIELLFFAVLGGVRDNIDAAEGVDIGRCENIELTRQVIGHRAVCQTHLLLLLRLVQKVEDNVGEGNFPTGDGKDRDCPLRNRIRHQDEIIPATAQHF